MVDRADFDVYFYEAFAEEAEALKRHLPAGLSAGFTWRTIQESGHAVAPAPLISTRTQSVIPVEWSGGLSGILTRSTGYEHVVDYRVRTGRDVSAGYLPLYCNRAVAEQALLLWLGLLRRVTRQIEQFHNFNRDNITGRECRAKTLLVVGVGNIGSEVVRIARGLDMRVFGVDLVQRHAFVTYTSFTEGAALADIVVCAMNLTPDNRGYFGLEQLRLLKPGCLFVNVARGELAPVAGLLEALECGHLGGVGLDVYEEEARLAVALRQDVRATAGDADANGAVSATLKLAQRDDAILLPHNAFNTVEAVERKAQQSIASVCVFRKSGVFPHPVLSV